MNADHHSPDSIDLSPLDATSDPLRHEALVASIMARYDGPVSVDLWTAIAACARPVGLLAAASIVAVVGTLAASPRPAPSPALLAGAGIPAPFVAWLARPSMPSPLEVMVAMAEIPR